MPRDIPTYTECAPPGVARSHQLLGGIAGFLINAIISQTLITVGALLGLLIGLVLLSNPAAWAVFGLLIISEAERAKDWYYNGRLLCIRDRDCAIGTVITEPAASFDGDRKLNLVLAPYSQRHWVETTLDHIDTNNAMLANAANFNDPPFHPPVPTPQGDLKNNFGALVQYVRDLRGSHPNDGDAESTMFRQVLIGVVDRLMADPARNFYKRYFRKDSGLIPPGPLADAIPDDFDPTVDWDAPNARNAQTHFNPYLQRNETLNPHFRYEIDRLVPYLHCEIDGYYVKLLIDNLIMAFATWLAVAIALSALGPLGALIGLAIALLVFLIKTLIDEITGNDGDADEPEVDWDDPDTPDGKTTIRIGDVVVTYGNWIMDTEHHNFFEIHPVRAYYLISRNSFGQEPRLVDGNLEQEEFGHEFDVTQVDAVRADEICRMIDGAEEDEPDDVILLSAPAALSLGMGTQYAGGHAVTRNQ
jgi:prepilin signal peptidase PulO-like enzyme (type II secretory pathway)